MSHLLPVILIALFVAAIAVGAVWAWMRRAKRDSTPLVEHGELPADAHVQAVFDSLYVVTTRHEEPLERIAAPGLAMRSLAALTIASEGLGVDLGGKNRFVLTPDRILEVSQATVAIDRVVEQDGLVRVSWRTDIDTTVDSYFRPTDASARALANAVAGILPVSPSDSQTGADA